MKNGISSVSRRVVLVAVALVLVTAAGDRPAYAVESKDVNVVNTPTVNARQSGAWDVGIDRVRIPFQKSLAILIPDGSVGASDEFAVPAGHRLIIEQVTALAALLPTGQVVPFFFMETNVGGVFASHFFPATSSGQGGTFVGCQQVRLYADPETKARFSAVRTGDAGDVSILATISGYLVPTP
jgi:hypothetical protein